MSGVTPGRPVRVIGNRGRADRAADTVALRRRADQVSKGAIRAAVLGANDGLVTNLCLILAIAGADGSVSAVRLAGFASLIAGAFSMAAGEWVSVQSQAELSSGLVEQLRGLIVHDPALVLDELTDQLVKDGFGTETAQRASTELPLDEDRFLSFTARTVFGVNPDELGSPAAAAIGSFALFTVGALVPLMPWFFIEGTPAVVVSIALTAVASLSVGGLVSASSGNSPSRGAMRQLFIVILASAITYGIGSLFGTAIA